MSEHNPTTNMTTSASQQLKLIISPAIDDERLRRLREITANRLEIINCRDVAQARESIRDTDGFFGKLTPTCSRTLGNYAGSSRRRRASNT
ncbi:MAG: hypothetical protein IAG10_19470, partial [Planctomycetaceae bacterium]|nr:hypothetical protein [Planctomycetaceae bacterium]